MKSLVELGEILNKVTEDLVKEGKLKPEELEAEAAMHLADYAFSDVTQKAEIILTGKDLFWLGYLKGLFEAKNAEKK